ncbi:PucR family transcriptional regulator [Nocardia takedensis]
MVANGARAVGAMASGRPYTSPLKDVRTIASELAGHLTDNLVPCRPLSGESLRQEIATVARLCLEITIRMLEGQEAPDIFGRLEAIIEQWAREGIPLDIIQHSVYETFRIGTDLVHSDATPADFVSVRDAARRQIDILDAITTAVTRAYVQELRAVVGEHHTATNTLTSALLGGRADSSMARRCGIVIADRYHVVAVSIPPHPDERLPGSDANVVARRKLRRVQSAIAAHCGGVALTLMSPAGGTLLVPTSDLSDGDLDALIDTLAAAAQVPITAATMDAATEAIPEATGEAHDLLDTAQNFGFRPGLHRLADVAMHHQLTRPGPALDHLRRLLDPLSDHPELMETLTCHVANNLNRRLTARTMNIHPNTVDYRLKRIGELTGCDHTQVDGLIHLRSALIARTCP